MNVRFLHIYGQFMWHDDANIVGDREAITALRDALSAALDDRWGVSMARDVFVNDGEGYTVTVNVVDDEPMQKMAGPYTDEMARSDGLWPHSLPSFPRYPRDPT